MLKKYIVTIALLGLLSSIIPASGAYDYTETGTIYENGDYYWDDNEINFHEYNIEDGETFQLRFTVDIGMLFIMFCDCDNYGDIEEILEEINYNGDSDKFYFGFAVDTTVLEHEYTGPEKEGNIAIFTYSPDNPSAMDYSLDTNIPSGSRATTLEGIIGLLFLGVIIYLIYKFFTRNKNKPRTTFYRQTPSYNYQNTAPSYMQKTQFDSSSLAYCGNCGNKATGMYCSSCGNKL